MLFAAFGMTLEGATQGCSRWFVDVGANVGDTLVDWFTRESCAIDAQKHKRPKNTHATCDSNA